jgi:hypothetical protein
MLRMRFYLTRPHLSWGVSQQTVFRCTVKLEEPQRWYASRRDGDWEYTYGIRMDTLEIPVSTSRSILPRRYSRIGSFLPWRNSNTSVFGSTATLRRANSAEWVLH